MEDDKLLDLKIDVVFQELFGAQKNAEITREFLSLILGREIKDIDLDANKRMLGNRKDSKTGRLDVRAKFNDGEDCDIELQVKSYQYMNERILNYWASMYTEKINSGNNYKVLKPSICILITNYRIPQLKNILKYHTKWNLREETYQDIILTEDMEIHILEMPKIKDTDIDKDKLALWLKFIQSPSDKEVQGKMEEEENKLLKQAKEELAYLSGDPDFKRLVDARVGFLRDQNTEKLCAEERGERKKQIEIAKKLLAIDMEVAKVAEVTGLTEEEIKKLNKNRKNMK